MNKALRNTFSKNMHKQTGVAHTEAHFCDVRNTFPSACRFYEKSILKVQNRKKKKLLILQEFKKIHESLAIMRKL